MDRIKQIVKECVRIDLDITGQCNRKCSFCPRVDDIIYPNIKEEMSLDTVAEVIRECVKYEFSGWIELAGRGESTLHKHFETIVSMLADHPKKTWRVRLTTNGFSIDKWWDTVAPKLDALILNSYDSEEQYNERLKKYVDLPNGVTISQMYKQDGLTVEEINNIEFLDPGDPLEEGFAWTHDFNNRAGFFSNTDKTLEEKFCNHPHRQIFINYNGDYQMCCNDWMNQVTIGNVHERRLFDMYANDEKMQYIRKCLQEGRRDLIEPCSKCDDTADMSIVKRYKKSYGEKWREKYIASDILAQEAQKCNIIIKSVFE